MNNWIFLVIFWYFRSSWKFGKMFGRDACGGAIRYNFVTWISLWVNLQEYNFYRVIKNIWSKIFKLYQLQLTSLARIFEIKQRFVFFKRKKLLYKNLIIDFSLWFRMFHSFKKQPTKTPNHFCVYIRLPIETCTLKHTNPNLALNGLQCNLFNSFVHLR